MIRRHQVSNGIPRPNELDDPALSKAFAALDEAHAAAAAAEEAVDLAVDDVAMALFAYGRSRRTDGARPDALIRYLYWERTDVRVQDLAVAFGLSSSSVKRVVGSVEIDGSCRNCGSEVTIVRSSRSDSRTPPYRCAACDPPPLHLTPWAEPQAW